MAVKNKRQTFNNGVCRIFNVVNDAKPGEMPIPKLELKKMLRYEERTVGMHRFTEFLQNDVEISQVIRMQKIKSVSTQDVVRLNEDTDTYRIAQIQYPKDVTPPCMDLSLERIDTNYVEA